MHGGLDKKQLANEDLAALERGIPNLLRHVNNITNVYQLPCVVAINRFPTDTDAEIDFIVRKCREMGVNTILSTVWAEGGKGGEDLAREVVRLCEEGKGNFTGSRRRKSTIFWTYYNTAVFYAHTCNKGLAWLQGPGRVELNTDSGNRTFIFSASPVAYYADKYRGAFFKHLAVNSDLRKTC